MICRCTIADDGFERHYAEKIWALIPEMYRDEDGRAARPDQLRALVEILADQAAIARRSVDRLWSDTRADEADDWAIPYIGALIGARPVSALNRAGQRANLARTILYRRRAGTPRLMELLADDIADWGRGGVGSIPPSDPRCGICSTADRNPARSLRRHSGATRTCATYVSATCSTAPTTTCRTFRSSAGTVAGRGVTESPRSTSISSASTRSSCRGCTARLIAPEHFTLDPSGRDRGSFQTGGRVVEDARSRPRVEMRAPISCRRLNAAGFRPDISAAPPGLDVLLAPIYGRRFATEQGLLEAANAALATDPVPPNALSDVESALLVAASMERDTPRHNLLPGGDDATTAIRLAPAVNFGDAPLGPERLYAANLAEWGIDHAPPGWVDAMVDPELGRVRLLDPLAADRTLHVQRVYYGAFWPVGAGTHDRASGLAEANFTTVAVDEPDFSAPLSGEFRFRDSRTFRPILPADGVIVADGDLTLSVWAGERPFVEAHPAGGVLTIRVDEPGLELVIDGLWLSVVGDTTTRFVVDGTWRRVVLRNVTIDPGGERAVVAPAPPNPIPAVVLEFGGAIDDIVIDRCVTGPIREAFTDVDPCAVDTMVVCDSIVDGSRQPPAILLRNARLCLDRTTVFGDLITGRLDASDVLVDGRVRVEDAQSGCFRFSAAAAGQRVPHPYESHFFAGGLPPETFVSRRFGDAGFAQLSEVAPPEIRTGGEDGTEMGAYHAALDPIKRADLLAKLAEFMPINAIPQLVFET